MQDEAVVVFTAKSIERIIREGGTSSWRLNRNRARQSPLVVCARNGHADWVEGSEPHRSAFLVGKILDVVPCRPTPENREAEKDRYLIQFSAFALVEIPEFWERDRNPVTYRSLEELGFDPSVLKWEVMPRAAAPADTAGGDPTDQRPSVQPLTMAEAKRGLALTFSVAPEAVEITIRG